MARCKHCAFMLIAVVADCAPLNRVDAISEATKQSPPPLGTEVGVQDPWAGRSGREDALSDIAAGRPVKLYSHVFGGERGGFRSPGLLYCGPDQNIGSKAAEAMFSPLPEANISEGIFYTPAQQALQLSAVTYARAYNLTMFNRERAYIVSLCPKIELGNN